MIDELIEKAKKETQEIRVTPQQQQTWTEQVLNCVDSHQKTQIKENKIQES